MEEFKLKPFEKRNPPTFTYSDTTKVSGKFKIKVLSRFSTSIIIIELESFYHDLKFPSKIIRWELKKLVIGFYYIYL